MKKEKNSWIEILLNIYIHLCIYTCILGGYIIYMQYMDLCICMYINQSFIVVVCAIFHSRQPTFTSLYIEPQSYDYL